MKLQIYCIPKRIYQDICIRESFTRRMTNPSYDDLLVGHVLHQAFQALQYDTKTIKCFRFFRFRRILMV